MKRLLILFTSLAVAAGILFGVAISANSTPETGKPLAVKPAGQMQIGDYFTLGKYNDEDILWRYVVNDDHGKLIVSDKILCFKPFQNHNFWEESWLRKWLNSTVPKGEVYWDWRASSNMWIKENVDPFEKGFLHESNFSASEKGVMKPVTQWTMLPPDHLDLSTNGIYEAYNSLKKYRPGGPADGGYVEFWDVSELADVYTGAAYEVTDTVFLMDEMQVYHMWENFGDVKAVCAENCVRITKFTDDSEYYSYLLRTPLINDSGCAQILDDGKYSNGQCFFASGIRPAFYLDEDNAVILSGSGTAEDPYVVDGKEISVSLNGTKLEFDQLPVIRDGIVLVPLRVIFEALGAKVGWDEATQTVTVSNGSDQITLQIGSSILTKNGTKTDLGYPAVLEGDRTMIPLNAISESFSIPVDWNPDALQATINNG